MAKKVLEGKHGAQGLRTVSNTTEVYTLDMGLALPLHSGYGQLPAPLSDSGLAM